MVNWLIPYSSFEHRTLHLALVSLPAAADKFSVNAETGIDRMGVMVLLYMLNPPAGRAGWQ
jgi:hypothetical protein